jgi:hypothetical protein
VEPAASLALIAGAWQGVPALVRGTAPSRNCDHLARSHATSLRDSNPKSGSCLGECGTLVNGVFQLESCGWRTSGSRGRGGERQWGLAHGGKGCPGQSGTLNKRRRLGRAGHFRLGRRWPAAERRSTFLGRSRHRAQVGKPRDVRSRSGGVARSEPCAAQHVFRARASPWRGGFRAGVE